MANFCKLFTRPRPKPNNTSLVASNTNDDDDDDDVDHPENQQQQHQHHRSAYSSSSFSNSQQWPLQRLAKTNRFKNRLQMANLVQYIALRLDRRCRFFQIDWMARPVIKMQQLVPGCNSGAARVQLVVISSNDPIMGTSRTMDKGCNPSMLCCRFDP